MNALLARGGVLAMVCCMLLSAGCASSGRWSANRADVVRYRVTPSPIEQLRTDLGAQITLEVHGDGAVHYVRRVGERQVGADLRLTPAETAAFFNGLERHGLSTLAQHDTVATEPLANQGRLNAAHELRGSMGGKDYRYFWSEGMLPPSARGLDEHLQAMLQKAEASAATLAEAP